MGIEKRIGNTVYNVPVNNENRWGERLTRIVIALIDTVSNLIGPADILTRETLLANGITTPTEINGLKFDTSIVQNIRVDGIIVRKFNAISGKSPLQDTFVINAASYQGQVLENQTRVGDDVGVDIVLNNNGQAYYTSLNIADTESITIAFYGKAILQEEN